MGETLEMTLRVQIGVGSIACLTRAPLGRVAKYVPPKIFVIT